MKWITVLLIISVCGSLTTGCRRHDDTPFKPTQGAAPHFVTWDTLEPDSLASVWLIKRFVYPDASFSFIPKGSPITNGIPFDTPESKFRRYHAISCFQSILREHPINDPAVIRIGEITHDIEINYWGEKRFPESVRLAQRIRDITEREADPQACISACLTILDDLYNNITESIAP